MNSPAIRAWVVGRFLPLSLLDYIAVVAAAIGLLREVCRWLSV